MNYFILTIVWCIFGAFLLLFFYGINGFLNANTQIKLLANENKYNIGFFNQILNNLDLYSKINNFGFYFSALTFICCFFASFKYENLNEVYWFGNWDTIGISINIDGQYAALVRYYSIIFLGFICILNKKICLLNVQRNMQHNVIQMQQNFTQQNLSQQKFIQQNINPATILYPLLLILYTSVILMTFASDLFNFFVSCELGSIVIYIISTCNFSYNANYISNIKNQKSQQIQSKKLQIFNAALNYLIYGSIGSGFILLGIGFLILTHGTFILNDIVHIFKKIYFSTQLYDASAYNTIVGILFLILGIFIKLSVFPVDFIAKYSYKTLDNFILSLIAGIYFIPFVVFLYKLQIFSKNLDNYNTAYNFSKFGQLWLKFILISSSIYLLYLIYKLFKRSFANLKSRVLQYLIFANFITLLSLCLPVKHFIYYLICESLSKILIFLTLDNLDFEMNYKNILQTKIQSKLIKFALIYYVLCVLSNPIVSIFWTKIDILKFFIINNFYYFIPILLIGSVLFGFIIWLPIRGFIFTTKIIETTDIDTVTEELIEYNTKKALNMKFITTSEVIAIKKVTYINKFVILLIITTLIFLQTTYN